MIWELLTTDVEGVESVRAVGAVFEQVFLGLGELFAGLVFAEAVASAADSGRLDSKYQVFVICAVEKRHKALLTCEPLIDEQVFFIVRHGVAEVDSLDAPTVPLELEANDIVEILLVDSIVGAEGCCIVIIDHGLVAVS